MLIFSGYMYICNERDINVVLNFGIKEIYMLMLCLIMCSEVVRFYLFGWNCIVLNIMIWLFF